ncbi:hypothetical protein N0102_09505, partial [Pseudomonas aeruginosa]|nr:hypothetical protein [Pseudomonas aeruginosa]
LDCPAQLGLRLLPLPASRDVGAAEGFQIVERAVGSVAWPAVLRLRCIACAVHKPACIYKSMLVFRMQAIL